MTNIAVIVGSLSHTSINRHYAQELEKLLPEGVSFQFIDVDLPLYHQEYDEDYPQKAKDLKSTIENADGVLIITPEHNRGVSAVTKNALDWASRPWGTNSFDNKPAITAGVSIGHLGTAPAQQNLRSILAYLNAHVMGQPEQYLTDKIIFGEDGGLTDDAKSHAQEFINAMLAHIKKING